MACDLDCLVLFEVSFELFVAFNPLGYVLSKQKYILANFTFSMSKKRRIMGFSENTTIRMHEMRSFQL